MTRRYTLMAASVLYKSKQYQALDTKRRQVAYAILVAGVSFSAACGRAGLNGTRERRNPKLTACLDWANWRSGFPDPTYQADIYSQAARLEREAPRPVDPPKPATVETPKPIAPEPVAEPEPPAPRVPVGQRCRECHAMAEPRDIVCMRCCGALELAYELPKPVEPESPLPGRCSSCGRMTLDGALCRDCRVEVSW